MIIARSPLRVPLAGGGTDLPAFLEHHDGLVVSVAISRFVAVLLTDPLDGRAGAGSAGTRPSTTESVTAAARRVSGVRRVAQVTSAGEVPSGTGLGSSAAYAAALIAGLWTMDGQLWSVDRLAEAAAQAERMGLGAAGGKQDHYVTAHGGLVEMRFSRDGVATAPVTMAGADADALQERLLLVYTGQQRRSQEMLARQSTSAAIDSLLEAREIGCEIAACLRVGALDEFGGLLHQHWISKRRRAPGMSNPFIDDAYAAALKAGALGGKLVGAGGGGFLLLYAPQPAPVRSALARAGLRELTFQFHDTGTEVLSSCYPS